MLKKLTIAIWPIEKLKPYERSNRRPACYNGRMADDIEARKQRARQMGYRNRRHGAARHGAVSREYNSWCAMIKRCTLPTHQAYHRYGGRGVTVCERWRSSFENFLADIGTRPAGKSLDRYPDKLGNYEPGNCRWATQKEQMANTRANHMETIDGVTKSLPDWALASGVSLNVIKQRIGHGWEPRKAIFTPKLERGSLEWAESLRRGALAVRAELRHERALRGAATSRRGDHAEA